MKGGWKRKIEWVYRRAWMGQQLPKLLLLPKTWPKLVALLVVVAMLLKKKMFLCRVSLLTDSLPLFFSTALLSVKKAIPVFYQDNVPILCRFLFSSPLKKHFYLDSSPTPQLHNSTSGFYLNLFSSTYSKKSIH